MGWVGRGEGGEKLGWWGGRQTGGGEVFQILEIRSSDTILQV